ncbi:MAG: acylphosphatase [Clostridia bacterium]|nr:acylphosphatase [Clostridia bacterium]
MSGNMDEVIRKRMCFFGGVQGVGFRWRAKSAANAVSATGWVRNEYDGSVTMEIQGTEAQIDRVVQAIGNGLYVRIMHMEEERIPTIPDERGFHAR